MALAVRGTGEKIRITVSAWAAGMAQASREWVQSGCRSDASRQRRCRAGGLKVLSALAEHKYLATLPERPADFGRDGVGPRLVVGEATEHVLNASVPWQIDASVP
jgi:hypothetical protein